MQPSRKSSIVNAGLVATLLLPEAALLISIAAAQPAEPILELWRRPQAGIQSLAVSPDGGRCALVTGSGEVICWAGGRLAWRRTIRGAEAVSLGPDERAVVYTPLDLLHRGVLILDSQGRETGHFTSGGPIVQVGFSPGGNNLAVGTAGGVVEIYTLDGRASPHHIGLVGDILQLQYDPAGNLIVTTAAPAWLNALSASGRLLWRQPAPPGSEFRIGSPARGQGSQAPLFAAITAAPAMASVDDSDLESSSTRPDPDRIDLVAFSAAGKLFWRNSLTGRDPHLGVMQGTGNLVVAYERADRRGIVLRYDRTMVCYRSDGSLQWQQGGMAYDPMLVCASSTGDSVLSLCSGNRFWLLSGRGQTLWSYTAAAPIRMLRASADGTAVAVATSDNYLALLKVSPGNRVR